MVRGKELSIVITCSLSAVALVCESLVVSASSTSVMVASKESATERYYSSSAGPLFDGIILGGSNAVYGLSAATMDERLHEKWANLGMTGWYGSFELFKNYVTGISKKAKFKRVKTIVISDLRFATQEVPIQKRDQLTKVSSERLLPIGSFLSVLTGRRPLFPKIDSGLFDSKNGDLLDYRYPGADCLHDNAGWANVSRNLPTSVQYLVAEDQIVRSAFPESEILYLIPPFLSSAVTLKQSEAWQGQLAKSLSKAVEPGTKLILLPSVYLNQRNLYCNFPSHLNFAGRQRLSNILADLILSFRSKGH